MKNQLHGAQIRGVCEIDRAGIRKALDIAMRARGNDNLWDRMIEVVNIVGRDTGGPTSDDSSGGRIL